MKEFSRQIRVFPILAMVALLSLQAAASAQDTPTPVNGLAPFDGKSRLRWLAVQTVGPRSLAVGAVSAGWSTLFDSPEEYDTHFSGFGKRYGLRLTSVATSNMIEAGLGAIWGEDPRYARKGGKAFSPRLWNVVSKTFTSRDGSGRAMPAYAYFVAAPAGNFVSNAWRPDSQATAGQALVRTLYSFLNRMAANAFIEFVPQLGNTKKSAPPPAP